jgi:hypothetical protein
MMGFYFHPEPLIFLMKSIIFLECFLVLATGFQSQFLWMLYLETLFFGNPLLQNTNKALLLALETQLA